MRAKVRCARVLGGSALLLLAAATAFADTLVLRDGRRVSGRLVSVRNGVVEFEEDRGFSGRTMRVDQDEVRSIEFESRQASGGASRPRGMREREVSVSARQPWTATGITVRAGQPLYFEAEGEIRWGRDRRDGPEGESGSPRNPQRPIPNRPGAALIGRIGDDAPFFIGDDEEEIRARSSGELFLGVNDDVFEDNSGAFRVTVYH